MTGKFPQASGQSDPAVLDLLPPAHCFLLLPSSPGQFNNSAGIRAALGYNIKERKKESISDGRDTEAAERKRDK